MALRARLIYNPTSGREEMKKRLHDILKKLESGGIETSCHATTGAGDATLAAEEAINRNFDMIIAAGGDGTLYEVVNGMAEKENRPPLGIIPVGTTNDFARALGIPKHWEYACDLIIQQHTRVIDVGKANQRYFINIGGGGSITELSYDVPSKLKTILGQLAYYVKGLEMLPTIRPIMMHLKSDVVELHEDVMMFLVANSSSIGGFEKLAPNASLDDGKFDVIVLKKCNLADFVRMVTLALRNEHVNDPHFLFFQTSQLEVQSEEYAQLNLDGEFGGTLPCKFSMLPSHLRIFVDETGNSSYQLKNGVNSNK